MTSPVEFYFDFSSPYAYFAAHKVDELIEGFERTVEWRPIMLGAMMKETGNQPLVNYPIKGEYCRKDWDRLARFQGLPWQMPTTFPVAALAPSRAFYWINDRDPKTAKAFGWSCFLAYYGDDKDISQPDVVGDIGARHGIDKDELLTALGDDEVKQRLKDETAQAMEKGVFGSPFLIVDGEGFWGADRLWMVKRWLRSGGW